MGERRGIQRCIGGAAESTHRALAALFRCRAVLDKAGNEKKPRPLMCGHGSWWGLRGLNPGPNDYELVAMLESSLSANAKNGVIPTKITIRMPFGIRTNAVWML